ncbi:MAG: transposase, partial [Thermotogota bacterium]|nr:transposase [Thermotogota bacterium]
MLGRNINTVPEFSQIDPGVWKQQWVVDSQAVGQGQTTLRYLARYVFRVAISNN